MPETGKRTGFASLEQLFVYLIDFCESQNDVVGELHNKLP